jgi:hypothetical protein
MKTCSINTTASEVSDAIRNNKIANLFSGKAETQLEAINRLELLQRTFESREVGEKRGYGVKGISTDEAFISETFTTEAKEKFERKKGKLKAEEISKDPMSIAQREVGTYLHNTLESLVQAIASTTYKDKVLIKQGTYKTVSELRAETQLNETIFNTLYKTAKALIDDAISVQTKKDPTGKVYIAPEQRLLASSKLAGTADLIFLYSDLTADHYDYKSMTAKNSSVEYKDGKQYVVDPNWIPFYKYEDWTTQLPKTTFSLLNVIGINAVEKSRIVPIQLVLEIKDGKTNGKVKQIETFASAKDYLTQIPIEEKTGIKSLDEKLEKLYILKNNATIELGEKISRERKEYLKSRIDKLTRAINAVIVERDIKTLVNDYTQVINKYSTFDNKRYAQLVNITEEKIKDKNNENYLNLKQHQELIKELSVISSIIAGSYEFYDRMGIEEADYAKYRHQIERLQNNIDVLTDQLKNELIKRIDLSTTDIEEIQNAKGIDGVSQLFNTFGEIQHPVFREAFKKKSIVESEAKVKLFNFKEKLKEVTVKLEKHAQTSGVGILKAYDKIINKETGNLFAKFNPEFNARMKEAREKGDAKTLDKYFKLKEDSEDRHNKWLLKIISDNGWTVEKDEKKIKNFLDNNSLEKYKFDPKNYAWYYELKPEYKNSLSSELYSKEYLEIQNTPALKEYYNFWTESMKSFRKSLGMENDYSVVPDNFIPYFRASLIESIYNGTAGKTAWQNLLSMWTRQADRDEFGYYTELARRKNVETGEIENDIPIFGIHPLYSKEGVIDNSLKSYDLSRTLLTFADVVFNYEGYKQIEAEIEVLSDLVATSGVSKQKGAKLFTKVTGQQLDEAQLFRRTVLYHIYGIKEQGEHISKDWTNRLNKFNNFQRLTKLGLEPIVQASASLSSKIMSYYEGKKGFYYNIKQMKRSEELLTKTFTDKEGEGKLVTALLQYFQFDGKHVSLQANELPDNKLIKLANLGLPFIGFRMGSEWIDNSLGLSMMQNYGIDANGRLKRLKVLPEGSKSLLERASIKDGKLEIEGMTLDIYNELTNSVRGVSRTIKGELSDQDQRAINFQILGKLSMTYKNWLPDLFKEHFNGIRYNNYTNAVTVGRFYAVYDSLKDDESKKFLLLNKSAWIGLGKLALDVPLSLFTMGKVRTFKANESRARALFEKFKADNMYDKRVQEYTFEEFLDYYNGQVKAMVTELQVLLVLITLAMLAGGDWDDDGKKDYKQYLLLNWTYRTINRVKRELGFFYGSEGVDILFQTSMPVTSVALDTKKALQNFVDEAYHDISGEKDPYDKTGYFYYTSKQIPFVYSAKKMLDIERDK